MCAHHCFPLPPSKGVNTEHVRAGWHDIHTRYKPLLFEELHFLDDVIDDVRLPRRGAAPVKVAALIHVHERRDRDGNATSYLTSFRAEHEDVVNLLYPQGKEVAGEGVWQARATALHQDVKLMAELIVLYETTDSTEFVMVAAPFCAMADRLPRLEQGLASLAYARILLSLLSKREGKDKGEDEREDERDDEREDEREDERDDEREDEREDNPISSAKCLQHLSRTSLDLRALTMWVRRLPGARDAPLPHVVLSAGRSMQKMSVGLTDAAELMAFQRKPCWQESLMADFLGNFGV